MSKQKVKKNDFVESSYFTNLDQFTYDQKWYYKGKSIDEVIIDILTFNFNKETPYNYWGIETCIEHLKDVQTYQIKDFTVSWLKMLVDNMSSYHYCSVYKITEGNEKVKDKVATEASLKFEKFMENY